MHRGLLGALLLGLVSCSWRNAPFPEPPAVQTTDTQVRRSNLSIPGGQTFELGGGHQGTLEVRIENVGPTEVDVLADGQATVVAPGEIADAAYPPGEMARLRNRSAQRTARLKVVYVQGDEAFLGMRYVEDDATP